MSAQWTVMVLGKAPDPAVDWNTKQEIEAEVWWENKAAAWCSGLIRHQACSGKMNSRLHTLVLILALGNYSESGQGCVCNWPGLARQWSWRKNQRRNSGGYPQSHCRHLHPWCGRRQQPTLYYAGRKSLTCLRKVFYTRVILSSVNASERCNILSRASIFLYWKFWGNVLPPRLSGTHL